MKATQQQALWAKLTFIITTLGTAAVITTLAYTAVAVRAAQTAAEATVLSVSAAHRSADAAEKASHTERAWVFYEGIQIAQATDAVVQGIIQDGCLISINWMNGGRTPATNVNLYINSAVVDFDNDIPAFEWNYPKRFSNIVGQGKFIMTVPKFIKIRDMESIGKREKRLYIYSRVEYNDVFNRDIIRVSEATIFISPNGRVSDGKGKERENINTGFVGLQNGCT